MNDFDVNNPSAFPKNRCFICGKKFSFKEKMLKFETRDKKQICIEDSIRIFGRKSKTSLFGGDYLKSKYINEISHLTSKQLYIMDNKTDLAKQNEEKGVFCCPLCGSTDLQVTG